MTDKKKLLKVKSNLKKRQPKFVRQDAHKRGRVSSVWRRPRGLHSKMRENRRGYRAPVAGGYQTPVALRGMDKHGLVLTHVSTAAHIAALDPKTHSLVLNGNLGAKKRLVLIENAKKSGFTIQNASEKGVAHIHARIKAQHEKKKEYVQHKSAKEKAAEKAPKVEPKPVDHGAAAKAAAPEHKHAHKVDQTPESAPEQEPAPKQPKEHKEHQPPEKGKTPRTKAPQ